MRIKELNLELPLLEYLSLKYLGRFQKSNCSIQGFHLHRYQKGGLVRYIPRENKKYQGFYWTRFGKMENNYNRDLIEFETKNGLLRISDNESYIRQLEEIQHDFTEYEYEYEQFYMMGKVPMWTTETEWTAEPELLDEDDELTGKARDCHHMYYGYRVYKDENGKLRLQKSPLVDDIFTIRDRYPYIKEKFVEIIHGEERDYQPVYTK